MKVWIGKFKPSEHEVTGHGSSYSAKIIWQGKLVLAVLFRAQSTWTLMTMWGCLLRVMNVPLLLSNLLLISVNASLATLSSATYFIHLTLAWVVSCNTNIPVTFPSQNVAAWTHFTNVVCTNKYLLPSLSVIVSKQLFYKYFWMFQFSNKGTNRLWNS